LDIGWWPLEDSANRSIASLFEKMPTDGSQTFFYLV
jgi:hypothetical protein